MKRLFIISLLCGMVMTMTRAQSIDLQPQPNIQPPTVASLMKYIDHPVGLYYGNPEINHTLYTLKDGAIELPITLQYNASGIKVDEEASWVGLGWNLNAGGMVIQSAVGMMDEKADYNIPYISDYPQGSFPGYLNIVYRLDDIKRYEEYYRKATEARLQPDVFYFSFPGGSGKFFIDYRDGSVHQIDESRPLKIEKLGGGDDWQITTEDGTQHIFDALPTVWQEGGGARRPISRTFLLSNSIYPNGQIVYYKYETKKNVTFSRTEIGEHIVQKCLGLTADMECGLPPTVTSWKTSADEVLLKSITTDNYIVEFNMSARNDLSASQKLDAIVVKARSASQWGSPERKICFDYSYFESAVGGNTWTATFQDTAGFFESSHLNKRLKLDAVYEADATGKKINQLSFNYYNPTGLPPKTSFAVDYWGYYNGQTKNKYLIPDFTNLYWNQSNYTTQHQAGYVGNRASNSECVYNGMLKSVQYSTGGLTMYSYEPHEYQSSEFVPTCDEMWRLNFGDASCVLSLRNQKAPTDEANGYFWANIGDKVRISLQLSKGLNTWSDMTGSGYALLFTPAGGVMKVYKAESFDLSNEAGGYLQRVFDFNVYEAGTFQLILTLPSSLGDQSGVNSGHANFTGKVYVTDGTIEKRGYNRGGGVRVKGVTYFETSDTSVPPILSYSYEYPATGGVLLTPLAFDRIYKNLVYCQATNANGYISASDGYNGIELSLSASNFHSAPYSTVGAAVCYPEVTVRKTRFGVSQGYAVHTFKMVHEISTECSFQLPEVGSGKPLSIKYYAENGTLLKSESYNYDVIQRHFYSGVTIIDNFNRSPRFYTVGNHSLVRIVGGDERDNYWGRYNSLIYGISSKSCLPQSKTVYQDGVSITTTYVYDNHGQLKRESMKGSDGKWYVTSYAYPADFNFAPYTTMAARNLLSHPVEVKRFVDYRLSHCYLTQYGSFGGNYLPKSMARNHYSGMAYDGTTFSSSGASTGYYSAANVVFLKRDAFGNPVHIRIKGEDIIYIWGYGCQYPVAEIRNSSYDAVQSALGCTPESLSPAIVPSPSVAALRDKLADAQVTTYTYVPLLGMKTKTAPNGEVTSFEYDGFGRLVKVLDHDGKAVEEYDYHYKN